uniref:Thioredoxin n=1 Tax=Branchiostoma floridae TaxID=7739 RepID=C3Z6C0_BRAFL|eukprot:XP_002595943.1 hypothetical protein BRAFLDRAFT_268609 [Branchiostoma floridae]
MPSMVRDINTKDEFDALLADSNDKLVVVYFSAEWSGPCRMMVNVFEDVAAHNSDVIFAKLDVDKNGETASHCDISSVPVFHCYKNGEKADEYSGTAYEQKLQRELVDKNKE